MGSISRTCKAAELHTMGAAKRKVIGLADTYARCPDAGEGEEQTLMALVTTEKMLKDAQAGHYAVGAFNVENLEFVMAVLAAAEETKSPVIMQTTRAPSRPLVWTTSTAWSRLPPSALLCPSLCTSITAMAMTAACRLSALATPLS